MNNDRLSLEIVTPDGDVLKEEHTEEIVFRRKEKYFEPGSEISILPLHGPALIKIAVAPIRYRTSEKTYHLATAGGFVEIKKGRVLVVTPRFELMDPEKPNPRLRAKKTTQEWRDSVRTDRHAMIGYSY